MAEKTLTSNQVVFLDYTDQRQLDVSIASNLPTIQVCNQNTSPETYSPDWSVNPLVLTPSVFVEATDVSNNASYNWYRRYGSGPESSSIATTRNITINANLTDNSGIVTYRCVATYQGLSATAQIVFTRNNSGLNGTNGAPAAAVQAQYSSDNSHWSSVLQGDSQYIRFSYDGGLNWTTSIKIKGEDGTGVSIKGTAYTTELTLVAGQVITNLYSDSAKTTVIDKTVLVEGDSYIVEGYLCVFNNTANNFTCTGVIQGPKGDNGTSSYTFIRYSDSSTGTNMSANPSGKTYIGVAVTSVNSAPASASSYTWSKYVGEDAKSITLSASSQIFKVNDSSVASPATIIVSGTPINTTITTWQYSTDGGMNFVTTLPTGVTRNGNQITVTGASLTSNSVTIRATDGTYSDTMTVHKIFDGTDGNPGNPGTPASLAFLTNEHINFVANSSGQVTGQTITTNVVAYTGSNKVTPTIGTITGLPTGMTINTADITTSSNELIIPIVIANNATFGSNNSNSGIITIPITSPVSTNLKLNWSKINTGASAALVHISPSALFFKSTTGKDGTFTPEYIYLYPSFQVVSYLNWQYSTNGGTTWTSVSSANGLTVGTYGSTANSLRIARTSTLYTDSVTSISFRCNSSNVAIYDTVSIAKIYDVVDLQIGGRNIALNSNGANGVGFVSTAYNIMTGSMSEDWLVGQTYTISLKGTISGGGFGLWRDYGSTAITTKIPYDNNRGIYSYTFICPNPQNNATVYNIFSIYNFPSNQAISANIEWIKIEKGNKATDWSPAPEDINLAITAAQTAANTANTAISDMSSDSILTPAEKVTLKREYDAIVAEKSGIDSQATIFSGYNTVTTAKNTYNTAYNNIVNNVNPILNVSGNSSINGVVFRGYFSTYHSAKESLLNAILNASKGYVDNVQIGGRNLLRGTKDLSVGSKSSSTTFDSSEYLGFKVAKAPTPASGYTDIISWNNHLEPKKNTYYTLSFYAKASVNGLTVSSFFYPSLVANSINSQGASHSSNDGYINTILSNEWTRYWITWKTLDNISGFKNVIPIRLTSGTTAANGTAYICGVKLEEGNKSTDWTLAPEDIDTQIDAASGIVAMLSNEAHFFAADSSGAPIATSIVLDVIGYKGSTQMSTTVGNITGLPSTGMTTSISSNNSTSTKITVAVASTLADDYGVLTIPITIDGKTVNKTFSWSKSKEGAIGERGDDAITFKIYSTNGYVLSREMPSITLQTFSYKGNAMITAGASYQWYESNNNVWQAVSGATKAYLDVTHTSVTNNKSYMCSMTFEGVVYSDVITIEDKNDINSVYTTKPTSYYAGDIWVVSEDYKHPNYEYGTILRTEHTRDTYFDGDWITATKYDERLKEAEDQLFNYNQFISIDKTKGLTMTAYDTNGNKSPFSTVLSNNKLSFVQGSQEVAYISNNKLNITEAEIVSPLSVVGKYYGSTMQQAPTINLGQFSLIVENNGSMSIISNL